MTGMPCCCIVPPQECCAELLVPIGWTRISACCIQRVIELEGQLLYTFCSELIHHDTRSASAKYRVKTRPFPEITGGTLFAGILCIEAPPPEPPGTLICTYEGEPLPECNLPDELCVLIEEIHAREYQERLLVRFERLSRTDTIEVVFNECIGEESPTCKYIWSTSYRYKVEYGQVGFLDVLHTVIGTSECCSDYDLDDSVTAPTCETYVIAGVLANTVYVDLTRTKAFATMPSGTITLNPGDTVVCSPTLACAQLGPDTFVIDTTDFGLIPWTPPVCIETTEEFPCVILLHFFDPLNVPPTEECFYGSSPDPDSVMLVTTSEIEGDLLTVPGVLYTCMDTCGTDPPKEMFYNYISSIQCEDLISDQEEIPYTVQSYTLSDPFPWTITV